MKPRELVILWSEEGNPPELEAAPDAAEALRQTYLSRFDPTVEAGILELLRIFEGLRFFERREPAVGPDTAVVGGLEACLADLRHLAGKLRDLPAEHEDDELTAAGLRLVTAAAYHGGRLQTIADDLEAALGEITTPATREATPAPEPARFAVDDA
jgi:hypothetical protein